MVQNDMLRCQSPSHLFKHFQTGIPVFQVELDNFGSACRIRRGRNRFRKSSRGVLFQTVTLSPIPAIWRAIREPMRPSPKWKRDTWLYLVGKGRIPSGTDSETAFPARRFLLSGLGVSVAAVAASAGGCADAAAGAVSLIWAAREMGSVSGRWLTTTCLGPADGFSCAFGSSAT